MVHKVPLIIIAALVLLGATPPTLAHDHGGHMAANPVELDVSPSRPDLDLNAMNSSAALPQSYFTSPEDAGLLTAHIILMVIAWFFILPIGKITIPDNKVNRTRLITTCRGHAEHRSLSSRIALTAFFLGREWARAVVGGNLSC